MNPKKLPGLWKSCYVVLEGAMRIVEKRLEKHYSGMGLKLRHVWVLMAAGSTACSQTAVARALRMDDNTMVKLIDAMQEMGLILRVSNMKNRREHILQPTEKGRDILKWVDANYANFTKDVFRPVSMEKLELMRTLAFSIIEQDNAEKAVSRVHANR